MRSSWRPGLARSRRGATPLPQTHLSLVIDYSERKRDKNGRGWAESSRGLIQNRLRQRERERGFCHHSFDTPTVLFLWDISTVDPSPGLESPLARNIKLIRSLRHVGQVMSWKDGQNSLPQREGISLILPLYSVVEAFGSRFRRIPDLDSPETFCPLVTSRVDLGPRVWLTRQDLVRP